MTRMAYVKAQRLQRLPPYLFSEMEKVALEKKRQGVDLISFGIGDPDLPTPDFILETLKEEASNPKNHNYSFSQGEPEFRKSVTEWYKKRFKVDLDPNKEVVALIGSKEGIANLARAFINPGDRVLVPDPAYPVYANGAALLCDGEPVVMPLLEENNFKPELGKKTAQGAKIIFLNYPNNPTAAAVEKSFLEELVEFTQRNHMILCYDNAYSEISFDGYSPPSLMQIEGSREIGIEIHSCSKTFNMTGDRIGFAVGNENVISGLTQVKTQIDSGPSVYVQRAAIRALTSYTENGPPECVKKNVATFQERRNVLVEGLRSLGLKCQLPKATFYVWANCGSDSMAFARRLLEMGVMVTPGIGFGKYGEGYIRCAFTISVERIREACERMASIV